jgi:hypothetical protein
MSGYSIPEVKPSKKVNPGEVLLVASGDLRQSANRVCWPVSTRPKQSGRAPQRPSQHASQGGSPFFSAPNFPDSDQLVLPHKSPSHQSGRAKRYTFRHGVQQDWLPEPEFWVPRISSYRW